jgi:hypothetical protein
MVTTFLLIVLFFPSLYTAQAHAAAHGVSRSTIR